MSDESKDIYWFKQENPETVVRHIGTRTERWAGFATNAVAQAWTRNIIAYYSCLLEPNDWNSSLQYTGEQGELVKMAVPQARSIIRQIVSIITKERLAFKAIAESQGSDVMAEIRLGNAVAERLIIEQEIDKKDETAIEQACVTGMGFFDVEWATDKGSPYSATKDGIIIYDGAVNIQNVMVQDCMFDPRITDFTQQDWIRIRTKKNRWDLVAQHPDLKDQILSLPKVQEDVSWNYQDYMYPSDDDIVNVYKVYHRPTAAMPLGRMLMYSDDRTVYFDGPNQYGCIPTIPVIPESIYGMAYGYPILSNLLPCQEMYDHSLSAIATNHSNLAVQNVACPRNANVSVQQVMGMNFLMYTPQNASGGGKPEPLNMLQSAPETFKFAQELSKYMLDVSYLNSSIRGQPPPGVTSGTAIATLTANSLEFLNGLSRANQLALERLVTLSVAVESKFAATPRTVSVSGKNNQSYQRQYDGSDLTNIKGFKWQRVNPIMQTLAGRLDIAEKLLQSGVVKSTQDYVSILDGAPLSQLTEVETSENDLIQSENDALMDGNDVIALITDTHPLHILKHKALLNDPMVRFNNAMVQKVLAHIDEHTNLAKNGDPFLMAMATTGKMPEGGPPPPQPPAGGGAPGAPLPGEPENEVAQPAVDVLQGERQ